MIHKMSKMSKMFNWTKVVSRPALYRDDWECYFEAETGRQQKPTCGGRVSASREQWIAMTAIGGQCRGRYNAAKIARPRPLSRDSTTSVKMSISNRRKAWTILSSPVRAGIPNIRAPRRVVTIQAIPSSAGESAMEQAGGGSTEFDANLSFGGGSRLVRRNRRCARLAAPPENRGLVC
ncbi:hypothetical protein B0T17DRAFT_595600 [Bombardia bombarda]|uniref:Uncharacterized protein n=1 Tax=Bombardia bombarda TaxID=252184 RepID=A0AA39XL57_9PEZI|nr:hypothetical protein B0T17DRAFT_595600 [Bombardia bombarda]